MNLCTRLCTILATQKHCSIYFLHQPTKITWGPRSVPSWASRGEMIVSIVMGVPLYRWMVYFRDKPIFQWMRTGGTPMTKRKPPVLSDEWNPMFSFVEGHVSHCC